MSNTFSSMLRLFLIQCLLTMILALPFKDAAASTETITTKVNSYLYEGEEIDLKAELALDEEEQVVELKVKAQGIENDATLNIVVNEETEYQVPLKEQMQTVKLNVGKKIKSLAIKSSAAFVRSAKAKVNTAGDQPHPEDVGRRSLFARVFRF